MTTKVISPQCKDCHSRKRVVNFKSGGDVAKLQHCSGASVSVSLKTLTAHPGFIEITNEHVCCNILSPHSLKSPSEDDLPGLQTAEVS